LKVIWIIANYPVFRAALQMPLSLGVCSIYFHRTKYYTQSFVKPFGDQFILMLITLPYDRLSGICNAALNIIEFVIQYFFF